MTASRLTNHARLQAALIAGKLGKPRLGTVIEYDQALHVVRVLIQPEEVETGWIPHVGIAAGPNWGIYYGPKNGEQVIVVFQENDREAGVCLGSLPNDEDVPPPVPAGEFWVVHETGSFLKFQAGGVVNLTAPGGFNVTGDTKITGKLHTTGNITSEADITDHTAGDGSGGVSMKKHRDAYNAAQYPGVASGGAKTGTTDHPAT